MPMIGNNRKGSTFVEAAVVFPLVIMTLITCILICMFFYTQTMEQSRLHMAMRQTAGQAIGHRTSHEIIDIPGASIETKRYGLFYRVYGKERITMNRKGLLSTRADQMIESIWTASDGVKYVRFCTLAGKVMEDDKNR